ncbi:hypothetical protein ACLOJK_028203 [Asimina triloba]
MGSLFNDLGQPLLLSQAPSVAAPLPSSLPGSQRRRSPLLSLLLSQAPSVAAPLPCFPAPGVAEPLPCFPAPDVISVRLLPSVVSVYLPCSPPCSSLPSPLPTPFFQYSALYLGSSLFNSFIFFISISVCVIIHEFQCSFNVRSGGSGSRSGLIAGYSGAQEEFQEAQM